VGGSFAVSAISICIGFGVAYLIDRNVKENVEKKWLRVMASIASIAIGAGLSEMINHVMGTVVFGFNLDSDKVAWLLFTKVLVIPIIFYTPVWISKFKNTNENQNIKSEKKKKENESLIQIKFETFDGLMQVVGVICIVLLAYSFYEKNFKYEKILIGPPSEFTLKSCFRIEEKESIEDEVFKKLTIDYFTKKVKLTYFSFKNQQEEEVNYENCVLDEYENVCKNLVEEKGEKVKTVLKFKQFENTMTYEIFDESDKLEKDSEAKWQCMTKKI
jgi:predicted permease